MGFPARQVFSADSPSAPSIAIAARQPSDSTFVQLRHAPLEYVELRRLLTLPSSPQVPHHSRPPGMTRRGSCTAPPPGLVAKSGEATEALRQWQLPQINITIEKQVKGEVPLESLVILGIDMLRWQP